MNTTVSPTKNSRVVEDGYEWIPRAGQLWGTYDTCAAYMGMLPGSFAVYRYRHNLKSIKHGKKAIIRKADLDRQALSE